MDDYHRCAVLAANPEAQGSTGRAAAAAAALGDRVVIVSSNHATSRRTLEAAEQYLATQQTKVRRASGEASIEYASGGSIRFHVGGLRAGIRFTMLLYDNDL